MAMTAMQLLCSDCSLCFLRLRGSFPVAGLHWPILVGKSWGWINDHLLINLRLRIDQRILSQAPAGCHLTLHVGKRESKSGSMQECKYTTGERILSACKQYSPLGTVCRQWSESLAPGRMGKGQLLEGGKKNKAALQSSGRQT